MLGVAMPSKTYNLMAAGEPLLALTDPDSELARVIDEGNRLAFAAWKPRGAKGRPGRDL